jgi:uncharacterized 2Fe-2S/4Fe-4S cluster protein (DUF4445 family)
MNGGLKWCYAVMATLAAAGVLGGIKGAMAQSAIQERVKTVEAVQKASKEAIETVPLTALKITYIQDDIEDIRDGQAAILAAIKEAHSRED